MDRLVTHLLLALDVVLMVWGQQTHPLITPSLPPPPTMSTVVNESVVVFVGEPVIVGEDERVTIDCGQLIDEAIDNGIAIPTVSWCKDGFPVSTGSAVNVMISADNRFCIITDTLLAVGGQLGTSGNYTCKVCNTSACNEETSSLSVCGEPHIMAPTGDPTVTPFFISLTCGQDIELPDLTGIATVLIQCVPFNGSDPLTMQVYKDGELIPGAGFPYTIVGADRSAFGTYSFVLLTEACGSDIAVSRILRQGIPPNINEGTFVSSPDFVNPGDVEVTIGSPIYVVDGFNVTIVCDILNGTSPITIMWFRNGVLDPSIENETTITVTDYNDSDVFTCRAENDVGFDMKNTTINLSAPSQNCTVTTIDGGIRRHLGKSRARIRFSTDGDPMTRYRCRLDGEEFSDCTSPAVYENLEGGKHTVTVKAFCMDDKGKRSRVKKRFEFRTC